MKSIISLFNLGKDFLPKFVALLIAMSSITGGILLSQPFYFGALGILGFLILKYSKVRVGETLIFIFLFICLFSLIINNPPSVLRAWERFGVYVLVLVVVSPLFVSNYASIQRSKLLYYYMIISVVLSIGSFFAFFLGINLMVRLNEQLEIGVGSFGGLMNHSMALGPSAGLSVVCLFAYCMNSQGMKRLFYASSSFLCFGACLLSASRAAVGSAIVAVLLVLLRCYHNKMSKMVKVIIFVVSIGAMTFPIWGSLFDFVIAKNEGNIAAGGILYSRENKYTARILEFQSSPIIGVGYNVVIPKYGDGYVSTNGQIEPGSSWLAIASMTGVIGLSVFFSICVRVWKKAWRIKSQLASSLLGGMLVFFLIHMIAEGYIFAPKSFMSFLFWLIMAVIYGISDREKKTNQAFESSLII